MSAVDHKAEAQEHYEEAVEANQNGKWETARFEMQLAKFHIEAASVEQQRIANLIAYGNMRADTLNGEPVLPSLRRQWLVAHKQIVEGLGLHAPALTDEQLATVEQFGIHDFQETFAVFGPESSLDDGQLFGIFASKEIAEEHAAALGLGFVVRSEPLRTDRAEFEDSL